MQNKTIRNFVDIVERRDDNTGGHSKRTSAYVSAITAAMAESGRYTDIVTDEFVKMVVSAAPPA